jgi:hypothetical protein
LLLGLAVSPQFRGDSLPIVDGLHFVRHLAHAQGRTRIVQTDSLLMSIDGHTWCGVQ